MNKLFFPERFLPEDLLETWQQSERESYQSYAKIAHFTIASLLVVHLFLVDLPSGFQPANMFILVRLAVAALLVFTALIRLRPYKIGFAVAAIALNFGQHFLMYSESRIPFFISPVFLIAVTLHLQLSIGFSLLFFLGNMLLVSPFAASIYPTNVPFPAQYGSIFIIGAFVLVIARSSLSKNLKIFFLNSKLQVSEMERMRAEKLAAIGTIAAGIAHQLGNSLNVIGASLQAQQRMIKNGLDSPELLNNNIARMKDALVLSKDIISSVNSFSKENLEFEVVPVREIIETALIFTKGQSFENVKINNSVPNEIQAFCLKSSVVQVFINLFSNAVDAVEGKPGTIDIQVHSISENTITISIRDNGSGMSEEIRERAFNPFVTSKPSSKGTGLGLYMVKKEVERNNGNVWFDSSKDGTVFYVSLAKKVSDVSSHAS